MRLTDEKIADVKEYLARSMKVTASSLIPQLSKYGLDLIDTIEALQQENNDWQERYYELDAGHSRLFKDFCKLQQENEQLRELAKAKAEGRLKILPAKPGDIIYRPEALQFCWVITKVEIYEDEIVFIDDSDNIFRPDDIGKTVFLTREAAEKALEVRE